jgi:hypothetical protein
MDGLQRRGTSPGVHNCCLFPSPLASLHAAASLVLAGSGGTPVSTHSVPLRRVGWYTSTKFVEQHPSMSGFRGLRDPEVCRAVPCHAVPCRAVPCRAVPCRAVPCHAVPCLPCQRQAGRPACEPRGWARRDEITCRACELRSSSTESAVHCSRASRSRRSDACSSACARPSRSAHTRAAPAARTLCAASCARRAFSGSSSVVSVPCVAKGWGAELEGGVAADCCGKDRPVNVPSERFGPARGTNGRGRGRGVGR